MKNIFFLSLFLLIVSCASNKGTYWCGDHPCVDKKEREAYFKKTMIVEIKNLKRDNNKNNSEIEKIIQQAKLDEKKRIKNEKDLAKQAKLEEKRRIREEKDLTKQAKLEEKRRIREEKDLTKQVKLEEKRRIKEEKDLEKQIRLDEKRGIKKKKKLSRKKIVKNKNKQPEKNIKLGTAIENIKIESSKFKEFVEKITKKNALKPYPDINDIPN